MKRLLIAVLMLASFAPAARAMADFEYDMREHAREIKAQVAEAKAKKAAADAAEAAAAKEKASKDLYEAGCKAEYIVVAPGNDANNMQKRYWKQLEACKGEGLYIIGEAKLRKDPKFLADDVAARIEKATADGFQIIAVDTALPKTEKIEKALEAARKKGIHAIRVSAEPIK